MTRIYLVDDHPIVRDGLRTVLQGAGHEVVGEGEDAERALADIAALQPQLLLLDLNLGARSGLELLGALKARAVGVRTLVLTMSALPRNVGEALRLGALGYVLKDSPTRELLAAVEAVAQGRRHLGPGVADLLVQELAAPAQDDPIALLSPRERQIARLVVQGRTSAAIGAQLKLSPSTVDTYRSRLMAKLGVGDVPALVRLALRTGLVEDDEE
ncbi:response regulator transcription factor [Azohydromonas lata]|uniref:Response regulator transcription factor n=1 Tax=Azohydromonas lata TaxID=45677 RepID=A0ABU5IF56_9BURK|nr:response regulator transcription factor [Azohydromonas lata]MDZ5457597.1 response regulator transcription factor [Azohydromonas lata]